MSRLGLLCVADGDIHAVTTLERAVALVVMLIGVLFFGYVISSLSRLIEVRHCRRIRGDQIAQHSIARRGHHCTSSTLPPSRLDMTEHTIHQECALCWNRSLLSKFKMLC